MPGGPRTSRQPQVRGRGGGRGNGSGRGRGHREGSRVRPQGRGSQDPMRNFVKAKSMPSFALQMERERRTKTLEEELKYLGQPPVDDECLLDARLVIPGDHMIPVGLDDPQVLKDICVSQKVWITRLETNVFRIRSEKTSQLRAGLQAMNKLIHNLRLSNDHLSSRFFLIDSGRDTMQGHTADLSQFSTELARTFNTLSVLKMYLKMRVSYGQFLVTRMRKEWSNGVSYPNFSRLLNNYARHGAFSFRTQLLQVDKAKQAVRALTEPLHDHIDGEGAVRYQCSLELVVENGGTLHGEAIAGDRLSLRLSAPKFIAFERHPRLDWSMAVPDMKSDWNLQVNAGVQLDVPEHLQRLWQNIELRPMDGDQATVFEEFASPEILVKPHIGSTNAIATTRLKMSAIIPFTDPRYAVQISVTRAWDGLKQGNPRVTWGIEFYGSHWEEEDRSV